MENDPDLDKYISIHTLLAESDTKGGTGLIMPTAISIHTLLAESDTKGGTGLIMPTAISIHTLLAESDSGWRPQELGLIISIHTLLAESDPGLGMKMSCEL